MDYFGQVSQSSLSAMVNWTEVNVGNATHVAHDDAMDTAPAVMLYVGDTMML